jgi:hypothetical protein
MMEDEKAFQDDFDKFLEQLTLGVNSYLDSETARNLWRRLEKITKFRDATFKGKPFSEWREMAVIMLAQRLVPKDFVVGPQPDPTFIKHMQKLMSKGAEEMAKEEFIEEAKGKPDLKKEWKN